jgi:hypothetical protein
MISTGTADLPTLSITRTLAPAAGALSPCIYLASRNLIGLYPTLSSDRLICINAYDA